MVDLFFGDLDYEGKIFVKFFCSLYLSSFSSFNFCNLSLDCLYNFSTKLSFALILKTKNDKNLFVENEKEEAFCCLSPFETQSFCFVK
jgi:hypothetical protein